MIRQDRTPAVLRKLAKSEPDARVSRRLLVERVWLYLKERFLSLRLLNDYKAIVTAASKAWKRLCREAGRLTSLTSYPWIMKIQQVEH